MSEILLQMWLKYKEIIQKVYDTYQKYEIYELITVYGEENFMFFMKYCNIPVLSYVLYAERKRRERYSSNRHAF